MATEIQFDTKVCGRCMGGGHYSKNAMGDTRCYTCNGSGKNLTPNGKKAKAALEAWTKENASISAKDITPGMVIFFHGMARGWHTVVETEISDTDALLIFTAKGTPTAYNSRPEQMYRRKMTTDEYAEYLAFAGTLKGATVVEVSA